LVLKIIVFIFFKALKNLLPNNKKKVFNNQLDLLTDN
jgi:hypothetical protein